jgi:alkylhydroperoxidase/carboxymuconolactone decarboxylase family protein YurZ
MLRRDRPSATARLSAGSRTSASQTEDARLFRRDYRQARPGTEIPVDENEETLRRLSLHDEGALAHALGAYAEGSVPGLDARRSALVRLAATIALRGELPSYLSNVEMAIASGATHDDIVGVYRAIASEVGEAAANKAAGELKAALEAQRPPVA